MVIFDLEDLDGARERAEALGVRVVWQIDLPDISGTHLHPADMRGAIVSIDRSRPYGTWRWGGPEWTGRIAEPARRAGSPGITVAVADPRRRRRALGEVLGVPRRRRRRAGAAPGRRRGALRASAAEPEPGIVEIAVEVPERGACRPLRGRASAACACACSMPPRRGTRALGAA